MRYSILSSMKRLLARLLLILTLLLMVLAPSLAVAASPCTGYVSPGQPVPLWEAPGTVTCFHGGTYTHTALLRITALSATYMSAPGETAVLVGPGLDISGHDFTLSGLTIDNDGAGVPAIVLRGANDTIANSIIHGGTYDGVDVRGVGARLTANQIYDFDSGVAGADAHCITVLPTGANVTVTLNTIHDCSGDGLQAFYPNSTSRPVDLAGGLIYSNTFYYGAVAYGENAIDLKRGAVWLVAGNDISGYGREPIALIAGGNPAVFIHKWARDVLVVSNVVRDSSKGIEVFGNAGLDTDASPISITVRSNTLVAIGPGYTITATGALSVSLASNLVYPLGLPMPATPTVTPTASPTASATPTPTATSRPTATGTATPPCLSVPGGRVCFEAFTATPGATQ